MRENGYIKLGFGIEDHWLGSDPTALGRWTLLLLGCAWRGHWTRWKGRKVFLGVGEQVTGVRTLARQWGCDKNTALRFVRQLEEDGMVERHRTETGVSVLRVVNYCRYQHNEEAEEAEMWPEGVKTSPTASPTGATTAAPTAAPTDGDENSPTGAPTENVPLNADKQRDLDRKLFVSRDTAAPTNGDSKADGFETVEVQNRTPRATTTEDITNKQTNYTRARETKFVLLSLSSALEELRGNIKWQAAVAKRTGIRQEDIGDRLDEFASWQAATADEHQKALTEWKRHFVRWLIMACRLERRDIERADRKNRTKNDNNNGTINRQNARGGADRRDTREDCLRAGAAAIEEVLRDGRASSTGSGAAGTVREW